MMLLDSNISASQESKTATNITTAPISTQPDPTISTSRKLVPETLAPTIELLKSSNVEDVVLPDPEVSTAVPKLPRMATAEGEAFPNPDASRTVHKLSCVAIMEHNSSPYFEDPKSVRDASIEDRSAVDPTGEPSARNDPEALDATPKLPCDTNIRDTQSDTTIDDAPPLLLPSSAADDSVMIFPTATVKPETSSQLPPNTSTGPKVMIAWDTKMSGKPENCTPDSSSSIAKARGLLARNIQAPRHSKRKRSRSSSPTPLPKKPKFSQTHKRKLSRSPSPSYFSRREEGNKQGKADRWVPTYDLHDRSAWKVSKDDQHSAPITGIFSYTCSPNSEPSVAFQGEKDRKLYIICYNCGSKVHDFMDCELGCGKCGRNGHRTINCMIVHHDFGLWAKKEGE